MCVHVRDFKTWRTFDWKNIVSHNRQLASICVDIIAEMNKKTVCLYGIITFEQENKLKGTS